MDRIAQVGVRQEVQLEGVLASVTFPAVTKNPSLLATIEDETGWLSLQWMGRREIPGMEPGARLRVWGRTTATRWGLTIINPRYELLHVPQD